MTELTYTTQFKIVPTKPFNFDATFYKPDHFTTDDHVYETGVRWQTNRWNGVPLGLKYESVGNVSLKVTVFSGKKLDTVFIDTLKEEIIYRYNLNLDLTEFYTLGKKNIKLAKGIDYLYGMRPGHPSSLYEYLIIGIILQNAAVYRSIAMFRALLTTYGEELLFDGKKLLCLWKIGTLNNVSEEELRALKVGYRAKSIKRIDEEFAQGKIDELSLRKEDTETQKKTLISLYGVGPATVWYLLFDVFHRWEVFDHISPWEQKLYSHLFLNKESATVEELLKYINQFGKYKHLAVHYLWEEVWWRRKNGEVFQWLEKEIRA